jgi:transposase
VVEAIRVLRVARSGAIKAHTAAINALHQMTITAPDPLRDQLIGLSSVRLVTARRCQQLHDEIRQADHDLRSLISTTAPQLIARTGVGPEVAGQLLVTAGDNPDRLRSEASFAALCGTNPLPASSGRTDRHRLNRGGDRAANSALHTVVIVRMRYHQPTRDYVARRRQQGLSNREISRCLKRYVARELLPLIREALTNSP